MRDIFPAVFVMVSPLFASAQEIDYRTAHLERKLPAVRTEQAIVIDGVLEVRAGRMAEIGAQPGDRVRHPFFDTDAPCDR